MTTAAVDAMAVEFTAEEHETPCGIKGCTRVALWVAVLQRECHHSNRPHYCDPCKMETEASLRLCRAFGFGDGYCGACKLEGHPYVPVKFIGWERAR